MAEKKITRRVVLGTAIAGVAGASAILHVLRVKYQVALDEGHAPRTVGGKTVMDYEGKKITLDIPKMELRTLEDEEKFKSILMEQLKKDPNYLEANRLRFEKWQEENKKLAAAQIDNNERRYLDELARMKVGEEEKRALTQQLKQGIQAEKKKLMGTIDKTAMPPVE